MPNVESMTQCSSHNYSAIRHLLIFRTNYPSGLRRTMPQWICYGSTPLRTQKAILRRSRPRMKIRVTQPTAQEICCALAHMQLSALGRKTRMSRRMPRNAIAQRRQHLAIVERDSERACKVHRNRPMPGDYASLSKAHPHTDRDCTLKHSVQTKRSSRITRIIGRIIDPTVQPPAFRFPLTIRSPHQTPL